MTNSFMLNCFQCSMSLLCKWVFISNLWCRTCNERFAVKHLLNRSSLYCSLPRIIGNWNHPTQQYVQEYPICRSKTARIYNEMIILIQIAHGTLVDVCVKCFLNAQWAPQTHRCVVYPCNHLRMDVGTSSFCLAEVKLRHCCTLWSLFPCFPMRLCSLCLFYLINVTVPLATFVIKSNDTWMTETL